MLRGATPASLDRLLAAGSHTDRELDTALTCLGVLPPLDLQPIRRCLTAEGASLVARDDTNGHRLIDVYVADQLVATITADGSVVDRALTAA